MKKKLLFLTILSGLALSSCYSLNDILLSQQSNPSHILQNNNSNTNVDDLDTSNNENSSIDENNDNNLENNNNTPPENIKEDDEEEDVIDERYITIPKRSLDLITTKNYSLTVDFYPLNSFTDEEKMGTWHSSDETVATVSQHGVVHGVSAGKAVISYVTNKDHYVASMVVYVADKAFPHEYIKVNDVDSIKPGDELIFACPDFGVAASINEKSYWIDVAPISFKENNTKLNVISDSVASFIVGTSKQENSDVFTLETQDGKFLSAKQTTIHRSLYYFKNDKAQIDWFVERVDELNEDFVVNFNLKNDYWLMFNKVNDDDIRFNIYDSNEQSLMKKPTIYRNTVIH